MSRVAIVRRIRRGAASRVAAILAAVVIVGADPPAHAADLPGRPARRPLHRRYVVPPAALTEVYPAPPPALAPGPPPSEHGYYGYYGFDIAGIPYDGLYSANVLCLRSIATPSGYRTVDVCR